jgi:hypothetical protein
MFKSLSDIGFNVRPDTGVPGFRVGLPEDPPGFAINNDGSIRRAGTSNTPVYGFDPDALSLPIASSLSGPITGVTTDEYCRQIVANCRTKCSARYEALGGGLGFPWMRICIRDCVAPSGCSY